jgi:hypothetical protein
MKSVYHDFMCFEKFGSSLIVRVDDEFFIYGHILTFIRLAIKALIRFGK